jgi:hypothetical protein
METASVGRATDQKQRARQRHLAAKWQAQPDQRIIDLSPLVLAVPRYSPTLNVKLPFTLWESDDITRHSTA